MDLTQLFKFMADKQASDMYMSANSPVLMKIEGETIPINNQILSSEMVKKIIYSLMSEANIKLFEETMELNFGYGVQDIGKFRINVFRQRGSVAMVARHIADTVPTIESLGLPLSLKELVLEKRGLILVVGQTGSGKSSTLAAMLNHRNETKSGHILMIEDPIEFQHPHKKCIVNQREVGIDTLAYESALLNAVRESPDVMMIGEIRDHATMLQAMIYAETGHLLLATLHANNSYHTLNRIINLFPSDARNNLLHDLSISLKAVVSQRLVRGKNGKRVPAVEVLVNSPYVAELIKAGETEKIKEAMEQSITPGSQTFEQALFGLYQEGRISLDEALANSDSPTNLSWLINNAKANDGDTPAFNPLDTQSMSSFDGFKLNTDKS